MQFFAARFGLVAVLVTAFTAHAQPAPAASSPSPNERAQHDADKVFRMILQHADKPRRAAREEAAPAAPAAPRTAPPAAARTVAPSPAAAAPSRATETRVSTSTPPAVPLEPGKASSADAGSAADASPSNTAAPALATPAAAVPVAALAPVTVAAPRSLKLELVSSVEPEFPARLVRSLGKGSVVVNFDVRPDGTVARTEVASTSHRGLNEAAQAAVAAWRFKPISETMPGVVELKFE
jgi:TonB family protein